MSPSVPTIKPVRTKRLPGLITLLLARLARITSNAKEHS